MVLPIALLTVGAIFIIAGMTNRSITEVINGEHPDESKPPSYGSDEEAKKDTLKDVKGLPRGVLNTKPATIDGVLVAGWLAEIVAWAKMNGWNGRVTSGIRSDAQQRQACIHVCGNPNGCPGRCAKPGQSNHRGTVYPMGAVDVTDPIGFARVLRDYPGGAPIKNDLPDDPVHFSRSGH